MTERRKTIRFCAILAALTLMLSSFPAASPRARAEEAESSPAPAGAEAAAEEENPAGTAAPAPVSYGLLKKGDRGEAVRALQERLAELGYLTGDIDGIFGSGTREAVIAFQRRNGLDADGYAGEATQGRLFSEDALPVPGPVDVLAGDLPMLTNKEFPVDPSFVPADLVLLADSCDPSLVKIKYAKTRGVRTAVEALTAMLEAAKEQGITKWQISAGYRSWSDQELILNNKINSYLKKNSGWSRSRARRAALNTVAEPGASEHHLGLSFDINVPGASSFISTRQCKWLHANCWDYGFIIRYQKGKEDITGFAAEAWHIRYVGVEHARVMRDRDLCLEEYLQLAEAGGSGE